MSILAGVTNFINLVTSGYVKCAQLFIGGTEVTSTAAELNILDGVTASKDELKYPGRRHGQQGRTQPA